MPLSDIDPVYPRIEKIEKNIKKLSQKLDQLINAHDAVANTLENSLKETQRTIASFMVFHSGKYYIDLAYRKRPKEADIFGTQVVADISSAKAKIKSVANPFETYQEFKKKCQQRVEKLGIKLIDLD